MDEHDQPHRDPARFDEVVASVTPEAVLAIIEREMGPAARAVCEPDDVWQETLALAWRDREQHVWEGPRPCRRWLLTIAKNRIRHIVRDAARPALFSGLDVGGATSISQVLPAGSVTPSRIVRHREEASLVLQALAALPDDERDFVRLHLLEEQTMDETAAALGVATDSGRRREDRGAGERAGCAPVPDEVRRELPTRTTDANYRTIASPLRIIRSSSRRMRSFVQRSVSTVRVRTSATRMRFASCSFSAC